MTFDDDPPRLKTLGRELPRVLSRALESSGEENPTPAELAELSVNLRRSLALSKRAAITSPRARRPITRGAVGGIALTFALGAGAGVLVSAAAALVSGRFSTQPAPRELASARAGARALPAPHPAPSAILSRPEVVTVPSAARPNPGLERWLAPPRSEPAGADAGMQSVAPAAEVDELSVLARAQALIATDPAAALALAGTHAERFPRGELVQEREVVAIGALMKLGRTNEAAARAASFHRRFPTSAHRRRVDVLLESAEPSSADHK